MLPDALQEKMEKPRLEEHKQTKRQMLVIFIEERFYVFEVEKSVLGGTWSGAGLGQFFDFEQTLNTVLGLGLDLES